MSFTPKTPYLSTDGIVEIYNKNNEFQGIVIIERGYEPFGYALPGGFVDRGESVEDALKREMKEEIDLDVTITQLIGVYSDPSRDQRFHSVAVCYLAKAYGLPEAGDDAKVAKVFSLNEIPLNKLVFDHSQMVEDYLKIKKSL